VVDALPHIRFDPERDRRPDLASAYEDAPNPASVGTEAARMVMGRVAGPVGPKGGSSRGVGILTPDGAIPSKPVISQGFCDDKPSKACVRAGVAQLVERGPSKVDVASSSLVSRCSSRPPRPPAGLGK
jgi:hypothetical protein